MGLFLSGAGINQEVSGGRWIWAVVLFTDDWLASQNHQIHLPTVTFITVIFKVTATCLVSQHWPPHIYSHLLPPPPSFVFPSLHLSSSLALSLGIWSVTLLFFFTPPPTHLLLLTTLIWLSFCPSYAHHHHHYRHQPPRWCYTHSLSHSAGQVEGKQGQRGVEKDRGERGRK